MNPTSGSDLLRAARALGYSQVIDLKPHSLRQIMEWIEDNPPVPEALAAAELAVYEYYKGDRAWAEQWLLRAYEANQQFSHRPR